ncbi:helix-turn-helix transcriptional regulator [Paenibacillus sp. IHBB 3054]|uniref:helix-turn-helix transcriptional regulator n=1 Tax=Paenibacillus sp. IHBB 3054 TaxID=3425689 RepID=UPI003F66C8F1
MSHIHRIQWFDQQIKAGRYPNSNHLAGQFEISKRQAQRDIEYMASSLRAPLQYVAKQRGYCYEDDSFMLPYLYMTDQEKQILKYLAYRYSRYNYENGVAVRRIGSLLERLTDDQEPGAEAQLPIFTVNVHVLQYIELLEHAIKECIVVRIVHDGQEGEQEICPLKLVNHYDDDHVIAKTAEHSPPQHFRLSSIRSLKLTERRFNGEADGGLRQDQVRKLKPFTAQIRLAAPPKGGSWLGFPVHPIDKDIYEVDFFDPEMFVQHLLTTEWLQILAPQWLQVKISSRCQAMLDLLNPQENPSEP